MNMKKQEMGKVLFHLFDTCFSDGHPSKTVFKSGEFKTKRMCPLSWDLNVKTSSLSRYEEIVKELFCLSVGCATLNNQSPDKYLYKGILSKLTSKGAKVVKNDKCWMTPQKSNVCTWQSIMAWQKHHLKGSTYKKLRLCSKVRTFRQVKLHLPPVSFTSNNLMAKFLAQSAIKTKRQLREAGLSEDLMKCMDGVVDQYKKIDPSYKETTSKRTRSFLYNLSQFLSYLAGKIEHFIRKIGLFFHQR